ncbi:transcriptional regulator [Actinosynnema pretiosum]|uniref:Transcriptional regulator n=1 Tax=Actinosynnema pretiosum TaxID=42197 RepID=A0A290Z310_9PSEU|nr:transcriptional regulator [Actinosynnema pretiosum]
MGVGGLVPEATSVDVTISIRVTGPEQMARRLADALRSALELPGAEVEVRAVEPARREPALVVLADSRRVLHRGERVELTRLEFDLLLHLCEHPDRVHRRHALMHRVWGASPVVDTRTVDVHIRRIRRKLGDAARFISTVRGVGYRLEHTGQVVVVRDGGPPDEGSTVDPA